MASQPALDWSASAAPRVTARAVDLESERLAFLATGSAAVRTEVIRPGVLGSWERSRRHGVDPHILAPRLSTGEAARLDVVVAAEKVFEEFHQANRDSGCALILLDAAAVVRARRDGVGRPLSQLLDGVLLLPGYRWDERTVGTTAGSIALIEGTDAEIVGAEHYASRLGAFSEAAALVCDPHGGDACGAVLTICHESGTSALQLPLARALAQQVTDRLVDAARGHIREIFDRFTGGIEETGEWVLASDGDYLLMDGSARCLDPADQGTLVDALLAGLVLRDFGDRTLDLPSGVAADVLTEAVRVGGEIVGCVLLARPADERGPSALSEAMRRQGSHVAATVRRDFAQDVRHRSTGRSRHTFAEARVRANSELLSPFLSARYEVATNIQHHRNHLLVGESGVGKRTLVLGQFRLAHPGGRVSRIDCSAFADEPGAARTELVADSYARLDGRTHLVLVSGLSGLSSVGARRLDEFLRPLSVLASPPIIAGCIDAAAVDATRPYGLVLQYFHEVTRIPPLRSRVEEVGQLAQSILHKLAAGRSLRLSHQVVRVLEGYAWPGNVSELEDALKYVIARKPVGEIQPPDLPPVCFQARSRKLSMLEAAQCEAIIQALYESLGNRYKAAAMLGIARSSLYRKIDAFGISYIA